MMQSNVCVQQNGLVGQLFPGHCSVRYKGRILAQNARLQLGAIVTVSIRMCGGKGGYGQLLKDFGKETKLSSNKKSMRDLSGRILRDLDDMKDFKAWLDSRGEKAQKKLDDKVARLKRSLIEPKHMMDSGSHYAAKERIEEEQSEALKVAMKRKAELDAEEVAKVAKKKKKKWYENSSDEEAEEKKPIIVRPPSEVRKQQQIEKRDQKLKKKLGSQATASLNELEKPKFKIEKGMVRVAAQADVALEPELEIWHDDFFEDVDPSMLKEYQIFKRDQLHAEKKKKEAAVISTPPPAEEKTSKETINFGDIDLADVNDAVQLEHYGMEHLKWLLESRGLKCGGNLQERCRRLLMTKGLAPDQYPKKIRAKK